MIDTKNQIDLLKQKFFCPVNNDLENSFTSCTTIFCHRQCSVKQTFEELPKNIKIL